MSEITIRDIQANGYTFRCRESGPRDGELVLLLHGFPETSAMWDEFIPKLTAAGFRVLAPDQRGYSPGARPEGKEHYRYIDTANDAIALADTVGYTRFHLVGHDWGAGCGWSVVCTSPQRVASYVALSVPHVAAFGRAIREDEDQKQRSQYVTFFQEPGVAEAALSADDFARLKNVWSAIPEPLKAQYLEHFSEPGALTGALNWYRGSNGLSPDDTEVTFGKVAIPTLVIWGNQDSAIGRKSNDDAREYMTGPYRWLELDAGHWLIQEQFETVSKEVLAHLEANRMRPTDRE